MLPYRKQPPGSGGAAALSVTLSATQLQGKQASARFPSTILCVRAEESINISRKKTEKKRNKLFEENICEEEEAVESDEELTVLFQKTYGAQNRRTYKIFLRILLISKQS